MIDKTMKSSNQIKSLESNRIRIVLILILFGWTGNRMSLLVNADPNYDTKSGRLDSLLSSMSSRIKQFNNSNESRQLSWDSIVVELLNVSSSQQKEQRQNIQAISDQCYVPEIRGKQLDMFDSNLNLKMVVKQYYLSYPEKIITKKSVENLLDSIQNISKYCAEIAETKNNKDKSLKENSTARYGFTEFSDYSDEQLQTRLGAIPKESLNETKSFRRFSKRYVGKDDYRCATQLSMVMPASHDWRQHNAVTVPKNQQECGSCWTFSTAGSIESAYLIKRRTTNPNFDLSEQEMLDCAKQDGCNGGNAMSSFSYVLDHGLVSEREDPYRSNDNACPATTVKSGQSGNGTSNWRPVARILEFCLRSKFRYDKQFKPEYLNDIDLMQALVSNGPLYIIMDSNPQMMKNYRNGILHGPCTTETNHAVLLVGYTPRSWIIKNSWGTDWGQDGFFELARGANMCGINTEIAFPIV